MHVAIAGHSLHRWGMELDASHVCELHVSPRSPQVTPPCIPWSGCRRRLLMVAAAVGGSALLAARHVISGPLAVAASAASLCAWRAAGPLRVRRAIRKLKGMVPDMDDIQKWV